MNFSEAGKVASPFLVNLIDHAGFAKSLLTKFRAVGLIEATLLFVYDRCEPFARLEGVRAKGPVAVAKLGRLNIAGLNFQVV